MIQGHAQPHGHHKEMESVFYLYIPNPGHKPLPALTWAIKEFTLLCRCKNKSVWCLL